RDHLWFRIPTPPGREAGESLLAAGFDYFCFLSALDWKPSPYGRGEDDPTEPPPERKTEIVQGLTGGQTQFQVFARVTDTKRHVGITLKVDVPDDTMTVESWFTVYAGANWHERETHEMFGISFAGHPDLRNMYLPTEFEGYHLRKDFPLLARMVKAWPGIVDVEPMPAEEQPADDEVSGEVAPENPTPEQSDAGVGEPPAEDAAGVAAVEHSVEEAPDHEAPPPGDEARTDSGSEQDLVGDQTEEAATGEDVTATPTTMSEERPADIEQAHEEAEAPDESSGTDVVDGTDAAYGTDATGDRDGAAPQRDGVDLDEQEVVEAEGDAPTTDEAVPSGRPADQAQAEDER
ncbi:MAG: NADH-quinone oxidoreductase subunit C, partial [Ilumatobacteraceae bacterium]